jgi:hypothetical protein
MYPFGWQLAIQKGEPLKLFGSEPQLLRSIQEFARRKRICEDWHAWISR